jgi:hypothetical protein
MSAKRNLYDFLSDKIQAALNTSPIYQAKLRFTHFEVTGEDDYGMHLSNVVSTPRPGRTGNTEEFDTHVIVTPYARIKGPERADRLAAYEKANAMALTVAGLILADEGLGNRTCNAFVGQMVDDFDELAADQVHAVVNLYVTVNHSGKQLPGLWGGG